MDSVSRAAHLLGAIALAALLWNFVVEADPSVAIKYCANVNTGSSTAGNHSIYQSDGLCKDFCHDRTHLLAVVQNDTCWCTDKTPDSNAQQSLGSCTTTCPGFPSDICGGPNGLFAYLDTGVQSSSSSPSGQTPGATTLPPTVQTVTESGIVRTVTATPTAGVNSPNEAGITSQSTGLGTGAAVGIAVAVVAIVVAMALAAFFFWRRKRQRETQAMFNSPSPRGSSAGMITKAAEAGGTPPYLARTEGNWESDNSTKRRSTLMPIDPRIDPAHGGMYNRNDNISHDSINTLRDDQDYSRRVHQAPKVLRATNPDPDGD